MFAISSLGKKLLEKLQRKAYRSSYVAEHVKRGIAYQIRALRDQREWKQGEFSKRLGKPQSVVCRLEDPGYGKVSVQTLLEVAAAFDVALQVRFVPFSTFIAQTRDLTSESMKAASFDAETALSGRIEIRPLSEILAVGTVPNFDFGPNELPKPANTTTVVGGVKAVVHHRQSLDTACVQ
ncbi:MAG TPA: helix-turn-helix transcriptional regulator [Candidatus Acidoferrum sp.]|nr:helix-turn-helix transcriptional regulator [Candidatus Acidoferrum sp.]HKS84279.1 helix-turn-helix transcriptional regulator [Pseudolabrys sp.]